MATSMEAGRIPPWRQFANRPYQVDGFQVPTGEGTTGFSRIREGLNKSLPP